jgi:hypothetical protein
MLVIIDAKLCEPPSSVACFRDVTLYSNCFLNASVLVECNKDLRDIYWLWLKRRGAFDFVEDFISPDREKGMLIKQGGNISVDRIIESNLNFIVGRLSAVKGFRR